MAQPVVTGHVIDNTTGKPIEFASVDLVSLPDSTTVVTTVTDKRGNFSIDSARGGSYIIICSFIGYDFHTSSSFQLVPGITHKMETIRLAVSATLMTEVTVTGRRTQLNAGIDRKIYNVEQDIMSRAGSVSDILKNIPSVEVDVEGAVSLRGSGDVMILINGKPNPLMGRTSAEVLQQLPANAVERIEVITNPSARYRPDGTSGIINIVLKKNTKHGFNGTATLNAGNKERFNGNLSANLKPGKLNVFGSIGFRQDTRIRKNSIDRVYIDSVTENPSSYFKQSTDSKSKPFGVFANGGLDFNFSEKTMAGISGAYFHRDLEWNSVAANKTFNSIREVISDFDRIRREPELEDEMNGTAYFQHAFKKEDHELRAEFNIATEEETEKNYYITLYRKPSINTFLDNNFLTTLSDEKQVTIDYTNPLTEDSRLEAGYDAFFNKYDIDFIGEYFDETWNSFRLDPVRTNRFKYNESVNAFYTTYQKEFEKFGYELGLRGEGVVTKSHLVTLDSLITNRYFKIYPTVHLSYKINDAQELQLNYSKRINRPDGDEMNPFPEYMDPRNLRAGNPKLLPEIIHSIEFGYRWQHKDFSFVPSIYFRQKTDGFTSVVIPLDDSTLLTTEQNLSKDQSAGLELIFSYKRGKFYSGTLSTNLFYNQIDAANLGYLSNRSIFSGTVNLNNNFNLNNTTIVQLTANYRSARLNPQGKTYPTIIVNSGVRKDLAKGKLSLTMTASDMFTSNRRKRELDLPFLKQTSFDRRDGFVVYLGLSWRFGAVIKKKEEKMEFDESLN